MEREYYQKQGKQLKEEYLGNQPEISKVLNFKDDSSLKDKENIFKDIYNSVEAWQRLCEFFQSQAQDKSSLKIGQNRIRQELDAGSKKG